jgi:hypothetical protein
MKVAEVIYKMSIDMPADGLVMKSIWSVTTTPPSSMRKRLKTTLTNDFVGDKDLMLGINERVVDKIKPDFVVTISKREDDSGN